MTMTEAAAPDRPAPGAAAPPPWLLDHAPYAPFSEPRTARAPGLMPLGALPLVTADADFAAQMARRAALVARRPQVVHALLPAGRAPAGELLDHVIAETAGARGFARAGARWTRPDGAEVAIDPTEPLLSLGRMVAEDWCLLVPDAASGEYRLVGAVLCFPSRWLLSEKLGRPLTAIHAPVPDYAEHLAARVNRVFEALRPERPVWRVNWLVHATAELHLPLGLSDKLVAEADPGDGLYLRTERQTLTRLPGTGAVAFGIKTTVCPLDALDGAQAAALGRELARLSPAEIAYRAGSDMHGAALARLADIAGQAGAEAAS